MAYFMLKKYRKIVAELSGNPLQILVDCALSGGAVLFPDEMGVAAAIMENILLRDAGGVAEIFRGHAGSLDDQLDLGGRHIGEGVDGQVVPGPQPGAHQQQGDHQHQQALGEGELDEARQHLSAPCRAGWP